LLTAALNASNKIHIYQSVSPSQQPGNALGIGINPQAAKDRAAEFLREFSSAHKTVRSSSLVDELSANLLILSRADTSPCSMSCACFPGTAPNQQIAANTDLALWIQAHICEKSKTCNYAWCFPYPLQAASSAKAARLR